MRKLICQNGWHLFVALVFAVFSNLSGGKIIKPLRDRTLYYRGCREFNIRHSSRPPILSALMAAINNLYDRAGNISCNKCKQSCSQVDPNYFPTAVNERARSPFWLNWLEYNSEIRWVTRINTYQHMASRSSTLSDWCISSNNSFGKKGILQIMHLPI